MDTEDAVAILYDVQGGVDIADSRLTYTVEMKAFRTEVEAEWEAWQKDHPDAILDVPAEMSSTPMAGNQKAKAKVAEMYVLTDEELAYLREKGSDHFYGAWKGGSAKAGGGSAESPEGRAVTGEQRWGSTQELITEMEAKYPGTDWKPMANLDPELAAVAADQIDTMFDRFGVVPSFRGIKTPEHGGSTIAEVKRLVPGTPGSAVFLYKDHFGPKGDMDKLYEQGKLNPTWSVGNNLGSRNAYARSVVAHEMGHEWLGLNLHSRLGADRNAPVRKELEPWLHEKFLPNISTAHVSKYARRNEHEAWAEVFAAATGAGSSQSHYVGELKGILDKHYPVK